VIDTEPAVGFHAIQSYLSSKGWQQRIAGQVAELWDNSRNYPGAEVLVPVVEQAADFSGRVQILISDLANLEQRDEDAVSFAISTTFFDVTDLEARHPQLIDDSIPLDSGATLFVSAQKLVVAAAGATIRRQGHFGRQMPKQARSHASHVRLGQTRRGSYILPVISRAQPLPDISTDEEPHLDLGVERALFDRRVMATFAEALDALQQMAVREKSTPTTSEILDSVGAGVSREMCRALADVVKSDSVARLDISFNWASGVSAPMNTASELSFPKESAIIIDEISKVLRRTPREREDVLYGLITDLHWGSDEEGSRRVGLETIIDRGRRTVWFDLDEVSYEQAMRYHELRQRVIVRGVLRTIPGQQSSMRVSHFGPDLTLFTEDDARPGT
jgi:hypothetical protein